MMDKNNSKLSRGSLKFPVLGPCSLWIHGFGKDRKISIVLKENYNLLQLGSSSPTPIFISYDNIVPTKGSSNIESKQKSYTL